MFRAEIKPSEYPGKTCFVLAGVTFEVDSKYAIAKGLGYGSHGVLAVAEHSSSSPTPAPTATTTKPNPDADEPQRVAIEKVENVFEDLDDARILAKELLLLSQLAHPNILALRHVMPPPTDTYTDLYVVYELMAQDLREKSKSNSMTLRHARVFAYELLCGLHFLHSAGITHADIRPKHLFINAECDVKIGHLASAFSGATDPTAILPRLDQPLWYCAPELLAQTHPVNTPVDLWSTGCILAEFIAKRPPFKANSPGGVLARITRPADPVDPRRRDEAPLATGVQNLTALLAAGSAQQPDYSTLVTAHCADCPEPALDLLRQLLQVDPAARITAAQALQHPWFAGIREEAQERPAAGPVTLPETAALESPAALRKLFVQLSQSAPAS